MNNLINSINPNNSINPINSCNSNSSSNSSCILVRKNCSDNNSLTGIIGNPNQYLTINVDGDIIWDDKCSFSGLNNQVISASNSGVVINTGESDSCLRTLQPNKPSQVLINDLSNTLTWIDLAFITGSGSVTSIITSDGLTANGIANGSITTVGTLGLDGWEINSMGKILRPKTTLIGSLGDPNHIILEEHLMKISLYNGFNSHSIVTSATAPYSWTTPQTNPSGPSLLTVDSTGIMGYSGATSPTQVLISTIGNAPLWIEQHDFNGLSTELTIIPFAASPNIYGVVTNRGTPSDCLRTLTPGFNAASASDKVLVTDSLGNMTWILQTSLPFVTSVGTSDGLTVDGIVGGTITTTGVLGLDGWEIVDGSKILRPKTGETGKLGDSTHIVNEIYNTTLKIVGANSNIVSIGANSLTTSYSITLPQQINSSFSNNSVMSIDNTGLASFEPKLKNDNITLPYNFITLTPSINPTTITTLNSVYAIDFTIFGTSGTFNLIVPDANSTNQGYSIVIYKKTSDNVNLIITTTSNQPINGFLSHTLYFQGQSLLLTSQGNVNGWTIMGSANPSASLAPILLSQFFTGEYNPASNITIIGPGSEIVKYTNVLNNNLPGVTYTPATGVFNFSIGGKYAISAVQSLAYALDGLLNNTFVKLSFINGINTAGTEITNSPCAFFNHANNLLLNIILISNNYSPFTLQLDRIVDIVAGQSYVLGVMVASNDSNGIVNMRPDMVAPTTSFSNVAGTIKINRIS